MVIKCYTSGAGGVLYWSGVSWERDLERAADYSTRREAEKEIRSLHPPRIILPKRKIEVGEF